MKRERNIKITEDMVAANETGLGEGKTMSEVMEDTFFMCGYDEEFHTGSYDWIRKERYFAIIHERYHGTIQEYRGPCSRRFFESRDYNKPMLLLKKGTPYFIVDMMM